MSDFKHKDFSGSLFPQQKEKETDRSYAGSAVVDGIEYWVSGYINQGQRGEYVSIKFKPKDEVRKEGVKKTKEVLEDFHDDDIPFDLVAA